MRTLEDRYRLLLRSYPAGYRRERSAELLDTLLHLSRPGQRYPTVREAVALLASGLRCRTGAGGTRTTGAVWAGGLHLGVLLLLASAAGTGLGSAVIMARLPGPMQGGSHLWLAPTLAAAALVLAAADRRRPALLLTLAALVAQASEPGWRPAPFYLLQMLASPLGLAAALSIILWGVPALRLVQARPAVRPWRWLLAIPALLVLPPGEVTAFLPPDAEPLVSRCVSVVLLALLAGVTVWGFVDARPPMAVSLLLMPSALETAALAISPGMLVVVPFLPLWLLALGLPLLVGALRAPRQARL